MLRKWARGGPSKSANFLCPIFGPLIFALIIVKMGAAVNLQGSKKRVIKSYQYVKI
jgi:hypothetical protein